MAAADEALLGVRQATRKLRHAKRDVPQILAIVREAEQDLDDQGALSEVYQVAMQAFGPTPFQDAREAYADLCLKQFQALAISKPAEALKFDKFLEYYNIQDPRVPIIRMEAQKRSSRSGGSAEQDFENTPIRPRTLSWSGCDSAPGSSDSAAGGDRRSLNLHRRSSTMDSRRASMVSESLSPIPEAPPCDSLDQSFLSSDGAVSSERQRPRQTKGSWPADPPGLVPSSWHRGAAAESQPGLPPQKPEPEPVAVLVDAVSGPLECEQGPSPTAAAALPTVAPTEFSDSGSINVPAPPTGEADVDKKAGGVDGHSKPPKTVVVNGVSYTKLQTIGRGGSSKVYQVQAPSGEILALKRVLANGLNHLEQLANEVALLQRLKDSANVIHMVDAEVVRERNLIHIVMEQGEMDLGNYLQAESDRDISLGDIQWLWREMLEAVRAVHQERIVHTDLKPANFLLVDGHWKLIDFGIAKRIQCENTHISRDNLLGTITYMAPESITGGAAKLRPPADVWSLGIILYQIVYGHAPFAHLDPTQRLLSLSDPSVAVEFPSGHRFEGHSDATKALLLDVLKRCLHRDPRKRAQISELLEHGFLNDSVEMSRRSFDRVIETLVASFFTIARSAICNEEGAEVGSIDGDENEDAANLAAQQDCCQRLADEVWDRMAGGHDVDAARPQTAELLALTPLRDRLGVWLARGAKRQKVSVQPAATTDFARQAEHEVGQHLPASARRPAAPKAKATAPPPIRRQEVNRTATTGGVLAPRSFAPQKSASASSAPAIQADMLKVQISRLKKTATGSSADSLKENKRPGPACPAKKAALPQESNNLVLQRLKDRRALVADDATNEELTQQTQWLH